MISDKSVFIEKRFGEIRASLSDINKAKSNLNWQPKVKLEDWIDQTKESTL
jgi:nucleoside-diphosphate-sugar epimerase